MRGRLRIREHRDEEGGCGAGAAATHRGPGKGEKLDQLRLDTRSGSPGPEAFQRKDRLAPVLSPATYFQNNARSLP